jgi:hypothetical protein
MKEIGISEISRNPALFNRDEIYEIIDKKSRKSKYIAIPSRFFPLIEKAIEEIEYARWLQRNREALEEENWGESWEENSRRILERP